MIEYNPRDWFWIVAGDESRAWSSNARAYVLEWPTDQVARIANEIELYGALAKQKIASRAPQGPFSLDAAASAFASVAPSFAAPVASASTLAAVAEDIGMTLPPLTSGGA